MTEDRYLSAPPLVARMIRDVRLTGPSNSYQSKDCWLLEKQLQNDPNHIPLHFSLLVFFLENSSSKYLSYL